MATALAILMVFAGTVTQAPGLRHATSPVPGTGALTLLVVLGTLWPAGALLGTALGWPISARGGHLTDCRFPLSRSSPSLPSSGHRR